MKYKTKFKENVIYEVISIEYNDFLKTRFTFKNSLTNKTILTDWEEIHEHLHTGDLVIFNNGKVIKQ